MIRSTLSHSSPARRLAGGALVAALALTAVGCSAPSEAEPAGSASTGSDTGSEGAWPRTIEHELGETVIDAQPEDIVATSVTLAGTLLAIDAPLTATAATTPSSITDDKGLFAQWADVADERGVEVLYDALELDLESVIAADPDLIVISTTGADATADAYDQLSEIAPTIAINYADKSWQDVAALLGEATGLEDQAAATVTGYDEQVAEAAAAITVPDGDVNAVVYNGTENDTAFAKVGGAHADVLEALGFTVAEAPADLDTSETARADFSFLSIENAVAALTADTVFLVSGDEETAESLLSEPLFANAPAVTAEAVYPLGQTSFRVDYYSALEIVDAVVADFGE